MLVDDYSELGSDMDVSSGSEEVIYRGKYSPESSPPQNGIFHGWIPIGSTGVGQQHPYSSDDLSKIISWLESQDEKPDSTEIKRIAVEGIMTCLQNAIDSLKYK